TAPAKTPATCRSITHNRKVGTVAIAIVTARPTPPRNMSERRCVGAGAKVNANARANAVKTTTSADSGHICRPHWKPSGKRRDQRGRDVRPLGLSHRAEAVRHAADAHRCSNPKGKEGNSGQ